ncbi:MAG: glycosyltransferase family 4 protein [Bacteroidota bacterium]|nr:glycosyltransferase family 4 protein [Bacteroidota bacterium]
MNIAVDARCFTKDGNDESANFLFKIFTEITALHKEHTFIFIFDKPFPPSFIFSENVIPVLKAPIANSTASLYIWYNIKIPLLLKKYKADVFIGADGFCSLTTKVPQCLVLNDLGFINFPLFTDRSRLLFSKKFTRRFIKKAKVIITGSEYLKAEIINRYNSTPDKIQVIYPGSDENAAALSIDERESIKVKYADGKEYFVYAGPIDPGKNLINLLKAFSAFKKRQKSSMRLLIVSCQAQQYEELITGLQLFRFKDDVKLLALLPAEEVTQIIASSYALIYVPFVENTTTVLLTAMKIKVPIITSSKGAMPEICGEAALYAGPENFKEIAIKIMGLFKDENLRKKLIEEGKEQEQKFSVEKAMELFWRTIEKTASAI